MLHRQHRWKKKANDKPYNDQLSSLTFIDTRQTSLWLFFVFFLNALSVLITYIKIMMYGSTTSSSGNSLCTWTHPIVASELRDDQPHIALILMNAFLDHNFNINLISGVIFQQKRYINAHKKKDKNNCLRSHFLTRDKLPCD